MEQNEATQRLVGMFIDMVRVSSPSWYEGSFTTYAQKELEALGFSVEFESAGTKTGGNTGNLITTLPGRMDVEPWMFCCHMDTESFVPTGQEFWVETTRLRSPPSSNPPSVRSKE